jgi:hypothetical protein
LFHVHICSLFAYFTDFAPHFLFDIDLAHHIVVIYDLPQ